MMKYVLALIFILVATIAEAACPVGSTCENYQGTIPYPITNPTGTTNRTPADRASDHGVNILDFGATRNNLSVDSSTAVQAAIDACYNITSCRYIYCPDGYYALQQSIFLDPPNSLRGGAPWTATSYSVGDIVTVTGTYYRATTSHSSTDPTPPSTGWVTSPAILWNSGATYGANDTVIYNGIMWKSVAGGNIGNTPSNAFGFWKQTVEAGNINPNWGASFIGSPSQKPAAHPSGCTFFVSYGGFPAMWIFGNGMLIENVFMQNNATNLYRCQNDPAQIAFAMAGGGSSLTTFRNVGSLNFYTGIETSANGVDNVNDSNYFDRIDLQGSCYGINFSGTQNFQNTAIESRMTDARYNVKASQNNGINIYGGNYTSGSTRGNTFTMSSVTFDEGIANPGIYRLTATLSSNAAGTWPDTNLTATGCSGANDATFSASVTAGVMTAAAPSFGTLAVNDYVYNPDFGGQLQIVSFGTGSGGAGTYNLSNASFTSAGSQTWRSTKRSDYPLGCTYDVFIVKTTAFGNIPFHIVNISYGGYTYVGNNWNNNNSVITLQMDYPTSAQWANAWVASALKADIESQTVLYASEMVTTFWPCGGDISNVHIENSSAAAMFINSSCTFGLRNNNFKNIYVNYQPDQTEFATTNPPLYLAQQTMPAIRAYTPLFIDGFDLGNLPNDRAILELSGSNTFVMKNAVLPFNIRLSSQCSGATFSGATPQCGRGSVGVGVGSFVGAMGGSNSSASLQGTLADFWRGGGVSFPLTFSLLQGGPGTTDFLGRRPDPSQASCVTKAFLDNYTMSLPSITTTGAASFTGSISGTTLTVSGIVGGNNLVANQLVYGQDMTPVRLGTQTGGTTGGNGTWNIGAVGNVSSRTMSTLVFSVPYPILYGGQQYRVCDNLPWTRNNITTNAFYSNHKFYSLGVNYTSTINPALAWSLKRLSPAVYMDPASLRLLVPGQVMTLTCNSLTKDLMIAEVRATMGYLLIIDANQDGTPFVPDFGVDCVGGAGGATLTVGQPSYSVVQF